MALSLQPPTQPGDARNPDDELDGLLRTFFRAEMPHPWPTAIVASRSEAVAFQPQRHRPLLRSRLALAASVALILAGSWFLARLPQDWQPGDVPAITTPDAKRIKAKEWKPEGASEFKSEAPFDEEMPPSKP